MIAPVLIEVMEGEIRKQMAELFALYDRVCFTLTQAEIDELFKEVDEAARQLGVSVDTPTNPGPHVHKMVLYEGFTDRYWFCEECDAKSPV